MKLTSRFWPLLVFTFVGYNSQDLSELSGSTFYTTASFLGINTTEADTFKLSQIAIGEEDFDTWNNDYISTIDLFGAQDKYYTFNKEDGHWYEADDGGMIAGDIADDVELPINQGIIILSNMGARLTFSGQVLAGETELFTDAGSTCYTGNFTPATITLGDIVVGEDFDTWNNDYIATIDLFGAQELYYTYNVEDGNWYEADDGGMIAGDIANDVEFPANKGFIVLTNMGSTLSLPSPIK